MDVPVAANVLGTIGAVCWSIQLIPQIIINYRRQNTIGLQKSMMLLWAVAGVPLGAYNITGDFNIALQIQPQILTVLSLVTWIQCYHYDDKWSPVKCCIYLSGIGIMLGGIEAGLVHALEEGIKKDRHWPVILMGVVSTILLSAGVLRHYYDIYVHRTVRGISFVFVAIDAAGDVFSLVSVFFQPELDILGMVIYATEFVLWCGVFACGGYFNLIPWVKENMDARKERQLETPNRVRDPLPSQQADQDIQLSRIGSSTSVFRTPSSARSTRVSIRSGD
ncbi:G protein-like protein-coupled receptor : PQ-loop [Amylocarpus encephaloides]|uniref:G protein-like protein-coupled receptor: PQ-loop n=1 Tax=Amylocarpus encephaloides TaxID=45428 RepID=A0A9P8C2C7_9HELO|nr:G protein-like protein-coupled receptor : PQ-loop [Amylocarpus encephaloides]